MLTDSSPEILEFLKLMPAPFGVPRQYRAVQRRAYIALDYDNGPDSWSGYFLVDRLTHRVYRIKGYGKRGDHCGTLESLTMRYRERLAIRAREQAGAEADAADSTKPKTAPSAVDIEAPKTPIPFNAKAYEEPPANSVPNSVPKKYDVAASYHAALGGFPDVNTHRDFYLCNGYDEAAPSSDADGGL